MNDKNEQGIDDQTSAGDQFSISTQKNLTKRLRFETLLGDLASAFLLPSPEAVDSVIPVWLERLTKYFGCDRTSLAELSDDGKRLAVTHSWPRADFGTTPPASRVLARMPWTMAQLLAGESVIISSADGFPKQADQDREVILDGNIQSMVAVPLSHGGSVFGGLGLTSIQESLSWTEGQIQELHRIAQVFAGILARKRTEIELKGSINAKAEIIESIPSGLFTYRYEPPNRLFLVDGNPAAERLTGLRVRDWIGKEFNEIWPEARKRGISEAYLRVMESGETFETEDLYYKDQRLEGAFKMAAFRMSGNMLGVAFENVTEKKKATARLRENEGTLRALLNAPTESAILIDPSGTILAANDIAAQRIGKTTYELVGLDIWSYLPHDLAASRKARGEEVVRTGKPVRFQDERAGRIYDNNCFPVFDQDGQIKALAVYSRDVTDVKRTGEALLESEQKYSDLINNIPDAVWTAGPEGHTTYISPNVERINGYTPDDIYRGGADLWYGRIHPDDRGTVESAYRDLVESGQPFNVEYRIRHKDGHWIWLRERALRTCDDGNKLRIDGVTSDITDRRLAEVNLLKSEEKFHKAFVSSPDSVSITRLKDGRLVEVNEGLERMLGFSREEILGKTTLELGFYEDPTVRDQIRDILQADGSVRNFELRLRHKSGEILTTLLSMEVIDLNNEAHILAITRDITERKRAQEILKAEKEFTQKAINAQVDTFFVFEPSSGKPVRWNKAFSDISGYSDEEIASMKAPDDWYSEEDLELAASTLEQVSSQGHANVELSLITKDGRSIPTEYRSSFIKDENGKPKYVISIGRDIAERKKMEAALLESEEVFRQFAASSSAAVWVYSLDKKRPLYINQAWEEITGYSCKEWYTRPGIWRELVHPDDAEKFRIAQDGAKQSGYIEGLDVEYRIVNRDNQELWVRDRTFPIRDSAGRVYRLAGLLENVTQTKLAEEQLRQSRLFTDNLVQTANVMIVGLDLDGNVTLLNPAAEQITGYTAAELEGKSWFGTLVPREKYPHVYDELERLQAGGKPVVFENPIVTKDGTERVIAWSNTQIIQGGEIAGTLSFGIDITERKRADEALRESEEKYHTLFRTMEQGVVYQNESGEIISANPAAERILGLTLDQMQGLKSIDPRWRTVHEDGTDCPGEEHPSMIALNTGKVVKNVVMGVFNPKADAYSWILINAVPQFSAGEDRPFQVYTTFTNITERKRAEEELMEKQRQLDSLLSNIDAIVMEGDPLDIYFVGGRVKELLGYSIDDWYQHPDGPTGFWSSLLHPDDKDKFQACATAIANGEDHSFEYRMIAADGREVWLYDTVSVETKNGVPVKARSVMTDITERKRAEEDIIRVTDQLQLNIRQMPIAYILWDTDKNVLEWNDAAEKIFGYTKEEMLGKSLFDAIVPEAILPLVEDVANDLFSGNPSSYSERHNNIHKDGTLISCHWYNTPISDADGSFTTVLSMAQDVSERMKAEEELVLSEQRLELAHEAAGMGMFDWSIEHDQAACNERYFEVFGLKPQERMLSEEDWLGMVHSDDRERAQAEVSDALTKRATYDTEYRIVWPDGSVKWVNSVAKVFFDSAGNPLRMIGTMTDITERKQAEEELQESQERYRRLAEASHEAIAITEKGVIRDANRQMAEMLGYQLEELLGEPVEKLVAPESRDLVRENIAAGHQDAYEHVALKKNGDRIPVEVRARTLRLEGRMLRVTVIRDLTDRKKADDALQERLRFESLLAEMSATFINLPSSKVDKEIQRWLQRVGTSVGAGRCVVWTLAKEDDHYVPSHSWTADGNQAPMPQSSDEFPWMVARLQEGESVEFRANELPPEASRDAESLSDLGILSGVAVPMDAGGSLYGALSLSAEDTEKGLAPGLDRRLRLVAEVIGNALMRKEAEEELQQAMDEISRLKDQAEAENLYLREEIQASGLFGDMIGQSDVMKTVMAQAEQVAKTDSTVLILGETGTGKELMARAIHDMSDRSSKLLITVNCAAMPSALVESELFGREKGAFTGALTRQIGRFEAAHEGTIFLDEVGELPVDTQAKLLRVLQSGQFERLGSHHSIKVDVRIITATNRDLEKEVRRGNFREDLFYRLNVFPITVPPLRDRPGDIPELVWAFVDEFGRKMGKRIESIPERNMDLLVKHSWPGNVRELRNVVERAMIRASSKKLLVTPPKESDLRPSTSRTLDEVERHHIIDTLRLTQWQVRGRGKAAELLGLNPTTLESRMKKLKILRPEKT